MHTKFLPVGYHTRGVLSYFVFVGLVKLPLPKLKGSRSIPGRGCGFPHQIFSLVEIQDSEVNIKSFLR